MDFNGNTSNGSGRLLSEIALPNFDIDNEAGNQEDYTALTKVYGDRLYLLNPDDFANEAHVLEASGYLLNQQQRAYVDAYQARERKREERPLQLPDYDLHF